MARLIEGPAKIKAYGTEAKIISEFIGNVNSNTETVSIARMESPQGWKEPGQRPKFTEYTIVLKGILKAETADDSFDIPAGQALIAEADEWVKYSSPYEGGAEYISVCLPAFSPDLVNRDRE